ncbi:hypothetical protein ESCO_001064 [Escovopsis weberi]|uniref:Uncharacterized protein n=1 Tax=Escovopsis weberi TaxID=150374 RepID=A0A0M8MUA8_ESCWE|nr:hypothetical protein ESCO_001064 [Escovopsis weberi]
MIGKNGWLECTKSTGNQRQAPQQKKTGILDSIKKIAKDMVLISLDTREQSLLYCELEFHITTALNDYITGELDRGRLVPDNLKRISDW